MWISVCELRGMRNTSTDFQQSDFISDAKPLMFQVAENIVLILVEVSLPHPLGHIQRCIYTVLSVVSGARILPVGEGNGTPLQCSCLENPMDRGAWWAAVHGVAKGPTQLSDFIFTFHFPLSCIGEGIGNPLQCSCLEKPRDGGAWWAAVYGVAESRTWLK